MVNMLVSGRARCVIAVDDRTTSNKISPVLLSAWSVLGWSTQSCLRPRIRKGVTYHSGSYGDFYAGYAKTPGMAKYGGDPSLSRPGEWIEDLIAAWRTAMQGYSLGN